MSVDTHKQQLTMVLSKTLLRLLRRFQADAVKVLPNPPSPRLLTYITPFFRFYWIFMSQGVLVNFFE